MEFLRIFVRDFLGNSAALVGMIAFIGLLLQKKSFSEILMGTLKTIAGFLIFNIGSSALNGPLGNFQALFTEGFNLEGVLPIAEGVTALAQNQYGTTVAYIMVLGLVFNFLVARFTRFKYIFLTGQHNLYFAALYTIMLQYLGFSVPVTIIIGGILLGFSGAIFPAIAQPGMRKITGSDDLAMGHYVTIGYALSSWVGGKVGNPEDSTENLKLPKWLNIFKDYVVAIGTTMIVFFYVAAIAAGKEFTEQLSGGVNWLIFPFFEGLTFAGALYVIITGVKMFISEIETAFVGISEKLIPNSKPALDCPVVFPFAPTATVLGFISAYIAGLLMMFVFSALNMPVIIPVAGPYFFIGATAGVFGNATGGVKGCILGSFLVGILIAVGPALIYPIMSEVGLSGTSFPETDFNFMGIILYLFGKLTGLAG